MPVLQARLPLAPKRGVRTQTSLFSVTSSRLPAASRRASAGQAETVLPLTLREFPAVFALGSGALSTPALGITRGIMMAMAVSATRPTTAGATAALALRAFPALPPPRCRPRSLPILTADMPCPPPRRRYFFSPAATTASHTLLSSVANGGNPANRATSQRRWTRSAAPR